MPTNRMLPLFLALIVGFGVGWIIARSQPAPAPAPVADNQLIIVGPDAHTLSKPRAYISKSKKHKVFWRSDEGETLGIYFRKDQLPKDATGQQRRPFEKMDEVGDKLFVTDFAKGVRFSGDINPELSVPTGGLDFKYWQVLPGQPDADGWIIINP